MSTAATASKVIQLTGMPPAKPRKTYVRLAPAAEQRLISELKAMG